MHRNVERKWRDYFSNDTLGNFEQMEKQDFLKELPWNEGLLSDILYAVFYRERCSAFSSMNNPGIPQEGVAEVTGLAAGDTDALSSNGFQQ